MTKTNIEVFRTKSTDGWAADAKEAAAELTRHLLAHHPEFQLSLWMDDARNPRRILHVMILDEEADLQRIERSRAFREFEQRVEPHLAEAGRTTTQGSVWLCRGSGVQPVRLAIPGG